MCFYSFANPMPLSLINDCKDVAILSTGDWLEVVRNGSIRVFTVISMDSDTHWTGSEFLFRVHWSLGKAISRMSEKMELLIQEFQKNLTQTRNILC